MTETLRLTHLLLHYTNEKIQSLEPNELNNAETTLWVDIFPEMVALQRKMAKNTIKVLNTPFVTAKQAGVINEHTRLKDRNADKNFKKTFSHATYDFSLQKKQHLHKGGSNYAKKKRYKMKARKKYKNKRTKKISSSYKKKSRGHKRKRHTTKHQTKKHKHRREGQH